MPSTEEIDTEILSCCPRQSKVAMVIVRVAKAFEKRGAHVDDENIATRIRALVADGALQGFGNLDLWRWSEVALTRRKEEAE